VARRVAHRGHVRPVDEGNPLTAADGPLIAVLDYGIGNLRSAEKALQHVGADARLTSDPAVVHDAAGVVLPGVGAFGRCMDALTARVSRRSRATSPPATCPS